MHILVGLGMLRLAQQQHGPASQHSGANELLLLAISACAKGKRFLDGSLVGRPHCGRVRTCFCLSPYRSRGGLTQSELCGCGCSTQLNDLGWRQVASRCNRQVRDFKLHLELQHIARVRHIGEVTSCSLCTQKGVFKVAREDRRPNALCQHH